MFSIKLGNSWSKQKFKKDISCELLYGNINASNDYLIPRLKIVFFHKKYIEIFLRVWHDKKITMILFAY